MDKVKIGIHDVIFLLREDGKVSLRYAGSSESETTGWQSWQIHTWAYFISSCSPQKKVLIKAPPDDV